MNTNSEKNGNFLRICSKSLTTIFVSGFLVEVDGQPLQPHEFHGVTQKKIEIPSRPYVETASLRLTVSKESVLETIKLGKNPYTSTNLEKIQLFDGDIDYEDAGKCAKLLVQTRFQLNIFHFQEQLAATEKAE